VTDPNTALTVDACHALPVAVGTSASPSRSCAGCWAGSSPLHDQPPTLSDMRQRQQAQPPPLWVVIFWAITGASWIFVAAIDVLPRLRWFGLVLGLVVLGVFIAQFLVWRKAKRSAGTEHR
jgi:hypothetical protein